MSLRVEADVERITIFLWITRSLLRDRNIKVDTFGSVIILLRKIVTNGRTFIERTQRLWFITNVAILNFRFCKSMRR